MKNWLTTRFGIAVFLLLAGGFGLRGLAGRADDPPAKLTPQQRQRNLEAFEIVWRTIRDKHWDPKLGGLDWQAVHDELRPQMEKAATAEEGRAILGQMIARLGQSHFEIIPAEAYQVQGEEQKTTAGQGPRSGTLGFTIRIVDGQALVTAVAKDLPAAKAGVRPGWLVRTIGKGDVAAILARVRTARKDSRFLEYQRYLAVAGRLAGKAGEPVSLVFEDGAGKATARTIPLAVRTGTPAPLGDLPTFYVSYESRTVAGNIGYFSLNAFFDPPRVLNAVEEAVLANQNADGFILDLRGNPGGIGGMAMGVGNWFVREPNLKLGTLSARDGAMHFVLYPRAQAYGGPLAILVDGQTGSTAEILSGGLQDLKRARIFGTRTAGQALPAQIMRLPNGDGFLHAFANYVSAGGQPLEGRGVTPDVEIPLTRDALLKGKDLALDAAVAWIQSLKK
jgi:carboxyl-terminal processing protease